MIRLILFDIDGTLIRTGGAGVKAFGCAFASEFSLPYATDDLSFAGRTDSSLVRQVFAKHGVAPHAGNFERFYGVYLRFLAEFLPVSIGGACPGARELLESIRRLPAPPLIGLLTGNIRRGAELKLSYFGLARPFQFGAYGDDHECRNELAVIARRRGAEILGRELDGSEVLVIGDTPLDIECARRIEAKTVAVASGNYGVEDLRQHQPTWAVASLLELSAQTVCAG